MKYFTSKLKHLAPIQKIVFSIIFIILILMIYFIFAKRYSPYSTSAVINANIIKIASEVSGYVQKIYQPEVNSIIKKGDLILQIDSMPYQLKYDIANQNLSLIIDKVNRLKASILSIKNQIKEKTIQVSNFKIIYERYASLYDKKYISQQNMQDAETKYIGTKYDLDSLYDRLKEAKASLGPSIKGVNIHIAKAKSEKSLALYYLNKTTLKASKDGFIENFSTQEGDYYIAGTQQIPLIVNNTWWIEALVKENSLSAIKPGQDAAIALISHPGKIYHGKVISIGQGVQTHAIKKSNHLPEYKKQVSWFEPYQVYPVKINLTHPGKKIMPTLKVGSSASVVIFTNNSYFWKGLGYTVMWLNSLWAYI